MSQILQKGGGGQRESKSFEVELTNFCRQLMKNWPVPFLNNISFFTVSLIYSAYTPGSAHSDRGPGAGVPHL